MSDRSSSKVVPNRGEFCIVTSSLRPDEVGYVTERTSKVVEVEYADGRVGKFTIDKNGFAQISGIWWTEEGAELSVRDKIRALQTVNDSIDRSAPSYDFPESSTRVSIDEFVDQILYDDAIIFDALKKREEEE